MSVAKRHLPSIRTLDEWTSKERLATYGIAVPQQHLVHTVDEAVAAADRMGYPVVVKRVTDIHKSDGGGVRVGLCTAADVADAIREMSLGASSTSESVAWVEPRFSVQQCLPRGTEMLLAVRRDAQFGLCLLIGRGGTEAEAFHDTAYRLWPLTEEDVVNQIRSLRTCRPWLEPWRGKAPELDMAALWTLLKSLRSMFEANAGLVEVELNPVIFWGEGKGLGIADARISEYTNDLVSGYPVDGVTPHRQDARNHRAGLTAGATTEHPALVSEKASTPSTSALIQTFFHPKHIAIIGATEERAKLGGRLTRYVTAHKFPGEIAYVNPKHRGQPGWYASLSEVPGPVDVALVAVPSHQVERVLTECRQCQVPTAIVYASGFAETGDEGRQRQERLLAATQGEVRWVGPNSMGIVSQTDDTYLAFGMTLEMEETPKGNVAVVSQSGALSSCLIGRFWESGIGFSRWITTGNEADLTLSDFLDALVDDDATSVIGLFIETIREIYGFAAAARRAMAVGKPIVALKAGRTELARKAIESHTGSLAGEDALYDDFFRRLGIVRAADFAQFSDALRILSRYKEMSGRRIGVVSTSGGANSLVADEVERLGLELPAFTERTVRRLGELIDDFGAAHNPVDVTVQLTVHPETFGPVVQTIVDDPNVDALLVVLTTNSDPPAAVMADALVAQMRVLEKPVVIVRMGPESIAPKALSVYRANGVPVFTTPEQGVRCLASLAAYAEARRRGVQG
ncbi:acetate--CoA ligase family protein [Alicyclobacillus cycloheptanicus]|uniref:Acyl-CoA synthetase (NDP forming) n=1 Tax=Alicyclobacillus cycloheptanicus TaxID=1457 RepID=A0ABT9XNY3_9BACL|nr:acetate--CoA ligase family protein [Alicyclobacillus cycloheptanicus]MDQ0191463.1 acyl-CoA synthetase (NDP forming) [Alicyclobacillus cycloheptanicus]WDM00161.1 acetate--CoA ligase family protein [Alicyclobacillus cycloheptanicus]